MCQSSLGTHRETESVSSYLKSLCTRTFKTQPWVPEMFCASLHIPVLYLSYKSDGVYEVKAEEVTDSEKRGHGNVYIHHCDTHRLVMDRRLKALRYGSFNNNAQYNTEREAEL